MRCAARILLFNDRRARRATYKYKRRKSKRCFLTGGCHEQEIDSGFDSRGRGGRCAIRVCNAGRCGGCGQVAGDIRPDADGFRVSRIGRLRSRRQSVLREQFRRSRVKARRERRHGPHRQGVARRANHRKPVSARTGRRAEQAQGPVGERQPAVGHRHRFGVDLRPEDAQGQKTADSGHRVRQRPGGHGQRALRQRQPRGPSCTRWNRRISSTRNLRPRSRAYSPTKRSIPTGSIRRKTARC